MTDLEKELARQICELSRELMALRERVAIIENYLRTTSTLYERVGDPK